MPYENSDDAERYSDHVERTEDPEREESDEDLEKEAREAADDLERREAADKLANEASDELDEMESRESDGESKELDDFDSKNDFDKERSMEDDLGHDLDEVRDDLHDKFVNDMERQLEGTSTKDVEGDETDSEGSSSEMTESSESYHYTEGGMAYAMRTKGGSGEAEAAETEEETQEVSEPEAQEPAEQRAESEETEEPINEKATNQIPRHESEESETAASPEAQETYEYNDARTNHEVSENEEETQEVSERYSESEPAVSHEDGHDSGELSEPVEESQNEGELAEASESDARPEDLEQEIEDILESFDEPESEPLSHEEYETDEETGETGQEMSESAESEEPAVDYEAYEQEVSEDPEVVTEEAEVNEIPAEDEPLPEDLDGFVERAKELLDERMEEDDNYDYVQDPLTGEIQRVSKILSEYESDEQKQRRKRRNLFAELSEEERERFKELVREKAEKDDERSAEAVERAWSQVVEKAEQEREELLEKVRQVLEDPEVMQLLESMSDAEENKKSSTSIESADDDDEVDEEEQFLTRGESRLRVWVPRVNGERIESVERLGELVRERYPGLLKHKRYADYIRQARLHLELMKRFEEEELQRTDIARIARETGESPTTVKRWLIEGAKPRVYHYLTRNPLDDREDRVAKLLSSLNGITDMETLEKRLRTLFLYETLERSKGHATNLARSRLFFQFLEEYAKGGILKNVGKRLGIGKSTISEWFNGSQLPSYVRMATKVPNGQPDTGKKWLPLRLNTRTNLPEQFIQVPDTITSEEDLLSVLQQLQSLDTPQMKKFEKKYGNESKSLAFMYLLGLIVSDGGFDADSDLSARVVLFASKKYRWNHRLGQAFMHSMGKIGLRAEKRADQTKVRDGKTTVFSVWGSQASPLLRWVKEALFGLRRSDSKKEISIEADWILSMPRDYRIAFLQGLADGDGYASIKTFRVGIATKTNQDFIKQLLSTFEIQSKIEKTKVVVKKYEDILRANSLPLFRHATSRKKNHNELCKIINLLDRSRRRVPERNRKIILELHKRGFTPGEITEELWFEHGIARSTSSIEGIFRRHKRDQNL
ncbi:MAG: LAGLIDADG family homing endonuclease [Candidatus Thorarchaeota archaeon]